MPINKSSCSIGKKYCSSISNNYCYFFNRCRNTEKIHGPGTTTLIISNEEMSDILKIMQSLKDSNILLKGITKTIKNETKEQRGEFLSMLLGTLGASLLGNMFARKGIARPAYGNK